MVLALVTGWDVRCFKGIMQAGGGTLLSEGLEEYKSTFEAGFESDDGVGWGSEMTSEFYCIR